MPNAKPLRYHRSIGSLGDYDRNPAVIAWPPLVRFVQCVDAHLVAERVGSDHEIKLSSGSGWVLVRRVERRNILARPR